MLSPLGVKSAQLVVGQVYFIVTYIDTQLSIPIVRSVAYMGQAWTASVIIHCISRMQLLSLSWVPTPTFAKRRPRRKRRRKSS